MPFLIFNRAVSFLLVSLLSVHLEPLLYLSLYLGIVFGHYFSQILYSSKYLKSLLVPARIPQIAALIVLAAISFWTALLPMSVFFGFHFIFSEVYSSRLHTTSKPLSYFRILVNAGIYSFILRHTFPYYLIPQSVLYATLVAALIGMTAYALFVAKDRKNMELLIYDYLGVGLALTLPMGNAELANAVCYHLFWWIISTLRILKGARRTHFVFLNAFLSVVFFVMTPAVGLFSLSFYECSFQSLIFGDLHITLSFALSLSNPAWINRFFNPNMSEIRITSS